MTRLIQVPGSIINISSGLAFRGGKGSTVYSASKAGVLGFTKSLAQELAPRIRVNAVAPGYVDTDMTKGMPPCDIIDVGFPGKMREALISKIGVGRFGTVEEVADVVLMLATNEYITGSTITIDGGMVYE
jgi:NAD(P)-dependent dehydrogenase (short-subunit alcohol dehydrogenase family)